MRPLAQLFPVLILAASALGLLSHVRVGESQQLHDTADLVRAEFARLSALGADMPSYDTFRLSDCQAWLRVYDALAEQWGADVFRLTIAG